MSDQNSGKDFPVILYDEHCNLCSATVMFVLRNDRNSLFRFLGLRSELRRKLFPLSVNDAPFKSVILIENGEKYFRSDAVLRIFRKLRFPVNLLFIFVVVPRVVRDSIYNMVAKNRFKWFGRRKEPLDIPPEWEDRFIKSD